MYNSVTTLTSTSSPTYSLSCSRLGPEPSSSAYRYVSSFASYTEPFPAGQEALPVQASSLSLQPRPTTLLAKKSAGSGTLPSACTQSTCTVMCPACIPAFWGSHALEGWRSQVRVHLEDLPRQASIWTRLLPGLPVPTLSPSTCCSYTVIGTDLLSRGMVCNNYSNGFALYEECPFEQISIGYWGTSLLNHVFWESLLCDHYILRQLAQVKIPPLWGFFWDDGDK